jgi:opacity protein-like surface antigen
MSAIVAADVTYTLQGTAVMTEAGYRQQVVKIAFGDGALTYPSGGVPLSGLSSQGFPNTIKSLVLIDSNDASGYVYKYDYETNKLRIYQSNTVTPAGTVAAPTFTGESYTPAGTNNGATPPIFTGTAQHWQGLTRHQHLLVPRQQQLH